MTADVQHAFRDDPDPGIHGAAAWLLTQWGAGAGLRGMERELVGRKAGDGGSWYVTGQGNTMIMVDDRGQPAKAAAPGKPSPCFAIGMRAVSIEQYLRFRPGYYHLAPPGMEGEYPAVVVSWFDAAAYCRWLSEQEGIPEDQMCYPPVDQIKNGMTLAQDYLSRGGYRLPTEWEWEQACRAGAITSRFYGEADALLPKYAWYQDNSGNQLQPSGRLKPNDLGLFEILGNTMAWCHGIAETPPGRTGLDVSVVRNDTARVARGGGYVHRPEGVKCTQRDTFPASTSWHSIGFRVARGHQAGR